MNKTGSILYMSNFEKDINCTLPGDPMLLKIFKEFSMIDIFRSIKQLPEFTGYIFNLSVYNIIREW